MKLKHLILTCFFISYAITSCKKQEAVQSPEVAKTQKLVSNTNNPYSISNMRKAFARILSGDVKLINNKATKFARGKIMFGGGNQRLAIKKTMTVEESYVIAESGINVSHYYIKFKPRNNSDMDKLKADRSLIIYPFPLDTEIAPYKGNYRDPAVPLGIPTYQYASVPVGYHFPDVPYEKLADLFIPEEQANEMITVNGPDGSSFSVAARLLSAESICVGDPEPGEEPRPNDEDEPGDVPPEDCDTGGGSPGTPGDPNISGDECPPMAGLRCMMTIIMRSLVCRESKFVRAAGLPLMRGITDVQGNYVVEGWYTRPADYWLDFERYEFSVNDDTSLSGAREIGGPKIQGPWDVQFEGYDKFCSTIFRAAYHYYYKDIQGLQRPPQNGFWNTQVKLGARNEAGTCSTLALRHSFGIGEMIHIFNPDNDPQATYATTIHELGHAVNLEFADFYPDTNVGESWCRDVQWVLTRMEYPNYAGGSISLPAYTNVVMDLIDQEYDYNPRGKALQAILLQVTLYYRYKRL
ncbi:hypothetical protein [Pedobacter endophyticus]|uniref:Uncharacterized protein n=1 Tax=Pedobacter endophyticus TaxID=2789740 RepID=A0A7U3Q6M5_9SPHI|nr:hypothetical protein [Pedobacter endophyticus]QPH38930.1 hypothetical protein IZT61_17975 [Pedobacter endophyticus]